jgi:hypothetical protein
MVYIRIIKVVFPGAFAQNPNALWANGPRARQPSRFWSFRLMFRSYLRLVPVAAVAALLAGCSAMPEWTKPTTWYDGVTGQGETEAAKAETKPGEGAPAESAEKTQVAHQSEGALPPVEDPLAPEQTGPRIKPSEKPTEFPNLAGQPEPRQALTTEAQQREIRDSLVADRDRAQYSADELRGGTQPAAAPPAPAAKNAANPAKPEEKAKENSADN